MAKKYYFVYNLSDGSITQHFQTELLNDTWEGMPDTQGIVFFDLDNPDAQKCFEDPGIYKYIVQDGNLVQTATDEELLTLLKAKQANIILNKYSFSQTTSIFQSSALGSLYTYVASPNAKTRYDAIYSRFHNDANYLSEEIYTVEGGYLAHNKDQFTQVWMDCFSNDKALDGKYRSLKDQVSAIQLANYTTLQDAINAVQKVVWS